jgi:hypothetical protein
MLTIFADLRSDNVDKQLNIMLIRCVYRMEDFLW